MEGAMISGMGKDNTTSTSSAPGTLAVSIEVPPLEGKRTPQSSQGSQNKYTRKLLIYSLVIFCPIILTLVASAIIIYEVYREMSSDLPEDDDVSRNSSIPFVIWSR